MSDEEYFTRPRTDRCGLLRIDHQAICDDLGIHIDDTDTQGCLRNKGVFQSIHEKLQLPTSFTVHGIFQQYFGRTWVVLIECPDFPVADEGIEYPEIHVLWQYQEGKAHIIEFHLKDYVLKV